MPYLEPAAVLRTFSDYAATEVRPALADDEAFMRGQVGSMASTLRFLAGELEGMDDAVATQRASLLDALEETTTILEESAATLEDSAAVGDDAETVDRLSELRATVEGVEGDSREIEATVLEAADEALAIVDDLEETVARDARGPLYDFLDDRLEAQLRLLGRPAEDG